MRLSRLGLLGCGLCALGACTTNVSDSDRETSPTFKNGEGVELPSDGSAKTPKHATESQNVEETSGIAEEVYVFMYDRLQEGWMCTGTLVAKDVVVTAAHCLEPAKFESYWIIAALAPGRPVVEARNPRIFGGSFEDVANPDIGFLTLDEPVALPAYAELTDVVADVESGAAVLGAAVVRTSEEPEAPFKVESALAVSSTVPFGYEHGFGTPMFSKGGDSGAGLFLFENGKPAHKLIGVARQPEPTRNLDHFTRIDSAFIAWFRAQTKS